jgi:hypothetical protein
MTVLRLDWIRSGIADGLFADVLPNPDENQVFEGILRRNLGSYRTW